MLRALSFAFLLAVPVGVAAAGCPLESVAYEDADGRGFSLEFGAVSGGLANVSHRAVIRHPRRGTVFEFDFSTGTGMAQALLAPAAGTDQPEEHRIRFFDADLKSAQRDSATPTTMAIRTGAAGKGPSGTRCGNFPAAGNRLGSPAEDPESWTSRNSSR